MKSLIFSDHDIFQVWNLFQDLSQDRIQEKYRDGDIDEKTRNEKREKKENRLEPESETLGKRREVPPINIPLYISQQIREVIYALNMDKTYDNM